MKELKGFEQLDLAHQERELMRILVNYPEKSFTEGTDEPDEDDEGQPIEKRVCVVN